MLEVNQACVTNTEWGGGRRLANANCLVLVCIIMIVILGANECRLFVPRTYAPRN